MKGVFVHDQIEYRLEVSKDGLVQGEPVPCTVSAKNHSTSTRTLSGVCLTLAFGALKHIREKKLDELEVLASAGFDSTWELAPGSDRSASWQFDLDRNAPVTDKSQTLCLFYGASSGALNQMPLTVQPNPYIQKIVMTLETVHQFVLKGQKSSKGWLDAKFKPPSAQKFSMVNELTLGFRFEDQKLLLRYNFNVKQFDTGAVKVAVKRGKATIEQELPESEFLLPGGIINHDLVDKKLDEALYAVSFGLS